MGWLEGGMPGAGGGGMELPAPESVRLGLEEYSWSRNAEDSRGRSRPAVPCTICAKLNKLTKLMPHSSIPLPAAKAFQGIEASIVGID